MAIRAVANRRPSEARTLCSWTAAAVAMNSRPRPAPRRASRTGRGGSDWVGPVPSSTNSTVPAGAATTGWKSSRASSAIVAGRQSRGASARMSSEPGRQTPATRNPPPPKPSMAGGSRTALLASGGAQIDWGRLVLVALDTPEQDHGQGDIDRGVGADQDAEGHGRGQREQRRRRVQHRAGQGQQGGG